MSEQIKKECEDSLFVYAQMMFPERYFGDVHEQMFLYFQRSLEQAMEDGQGDCAAALIPRDHQKSFCIAVALSWAITKYPWITSTYVSSNPDLAERQLTIIKNIFKSPIHRKFWPEMLNFVEDPRTGEEKHKPTGSWTQTEIMVDHPLRPSSEKDPTILATSAKSTNTGGHVKIVVYDDLVTDENYDSLAGKQEVKKAYTSFSKIATSGSIEWLVGTRYGPDDLYADLKELTYEKYDDEGHLCDEVDVWKWFERVVEDSEGQDGSGNWLWPRAKTGNGNWYGFDRTEWSKKRAKSLGNLALFGCQYYNNPNYAATDNVSEDMFMYIQPKALRQVDGKWMYGDKVLKLNAGMDLAFSESTGQTRVKRDFTAIAVTAWDSDGFLYILELRRFQTSHAEVYYEHLREMYNYWNFQEVTVETNSGGKVVANALQSSLRQDGLMLQVNHQHKNQMSGTKAERNEQLLYPLYRTRSVYHVKGGHMRDYETEVRLTRPPHDDLMDAVFISVSTSKRAPKERKSRHRGNVVSITRFGSGRRRRA